MTSKANNNLTSIAAAMADAFATHETSGGLVVALCNRVHKVYKGKPIGDADVAFITDELARLREWSEASARVRKAEAKAILLTYAQLPETVAQIGQRKSVSFKSAVGLARALLGGKNRKALTPKQAATAFVKGQKTKASPAKDRTKEEAWKSIKTHAKRMLEFTQLPREFRAQLRELCIEHGVDL